MIAFARALPRIRKRVARDLRRCGLPREKVPAALVRLLETTLIRVGNDEYARDNDSFGLTTMRDRHADVNGSRIRFDFRGKSGIEREIDVRDARLAKVVRTWAGTALAAQALQEFEDFDSQAGAKRNITHAIERVAERLGNTKAVCRKCYVHPAIIDAYLDRSLVATLKARTEKELRGSLSTLSPEEAAVLALLQQRMH